MKMSALLWSAVQVCLVNANIQLNRKKLGQGCGNSVWKWEQERPMFSLTSAVQISPQKKLCACVYEWVCVHVRGQRSQLWEEEVQTQHSQKWPLQSRIMWKSHHTETFPLWSLWTQNTLGTDRHKSQKGPFKVGTLMKNTVFTFLKSDSLIIPSWCFWKGAGQNWSIGTL